MSDRCYMLPSGVVVHASAPPSPELARALDGLAVAAENLLAERTPEEAAAQAARYEAGQARIRARRRRMQGDAQ